MTETRCEPLDGSDAAGDLEADHRAESRLLPQRDVVSDVRPQSWVIQPSDERVLAKRGDDRFAVLAMLADADVERAQAAKRQIAVEGSAGHAKRIPPPAQLITDRGV